MTIAERIMSVMPQKGCRVFALRCVLHDIRPAELDYALQGLFIAKRLSFSDGYLTPVRLSPPAASAPYRPGPNHPWKKSLVVQKERP